MENKMFGEFDNKKYQNNPIKTNRNLLFSKKIRIFNAGKQFLISPLFFCWEKNDRNKVFDNQDNTIGEYNLFTNNLGSKYLIITCDDVLAHIQPGLLDFDKAINIDTIDVETYNNWKNVIE